VTEAKPVTAEDVGRLEQLIAYIDNAPNSEIPQKGARMLARMVRSTLEIHKPVPDTGNTMQGHDPIVVCEHCAGEHEWDEGLAQCIYPCPTVVSIVRCLGEEAQNG
jgi:hypothetical protein